MTVDLDSERYAARYQQKFFFNDATPGFVLEYPAENLPPSETRKELVQEWEERYKGFRNRGKVAFLFGAKANVITMNMKDMDFSVLRKFNREAIMAAYHLPPSKLGIVENVNRATAVNADYDFQNNCIHPELCELRESINKELIPFFGDDLFVDFDNPVPQDETLTVNNTVALYQAGIITRNDALGNIGMEQLDNPLGMEYAKPAAAAGFNPQPIGQFEPLKAKMVKMMPSTDDEKEAFWKDYVWRAESFETRTITTLKEMYLLQEQEALARLQEAQGATVELIDLTAAKKDYIDRMTPILSEVMDGAIKQGRELITPPNPNKQEGDIPIILSEAAMKWLMTRMGWAAAEIGEETAARLAMVLAEGYKEGQSITQIATSISKEFDYFSKIRSMRIARTEVIQASAQGAIEGYKEVGLEKVQFYTAMDERTCPACNSLHNEIFTVKDSVGVITVHPQCRCVWLPVVD